MSFPLRFPDDDPRFTAELVDAVANVLVQHGYPRPDSTDTSHADLRAALAGFLYGPAFNNGDKVTWVRDGKVWNGKVSYVANGNSGQVARIKADPQPGDRYYVTAVVPCRDLTLVQAGDQR